MIAGLTAMQPAAPPPDWLAHYTGADLGSFALATGIVLLLGCAILFAVIAAVLRYRNRRKEKEWLEREARWELPLLEVLAGSESPRVLWDLVGRDEQLYFVDYLLRFARRTRGHTRDILAGLAHPYLGQVAGRIATGDTERRARAVDTVALLGFAEYGKLIVAALDDPSPFVSMIAARCIARQQSPEHARLLVGHLSRLADWSPRQLTAMLASLGHEAAPCLRAAFADPANAPGLRAVAADALRRLHDPEALAVAGAVLETAASDRDLVAAALRLVAELGGPEQAALVRPFCTHTDAVIRATAIQALPTTGALEDADSLRHALADESGWVAIQAARALMGSGDLRSLRALARAGEPRSALARQVLMEGM